MSTITVIVIMNTALAIIGIIGWSIFHRKFKEPAAIAPLTWLINVAVFGIYYIYSLQTLSIITGERLELIRAWGSLINTHGILLLGFGVIIAIIRLRNNKTYMDRLAKKIEDDRLRDENKNGNI